MIHLAMIDWAGPCPFGEQALTLRNIAVIYLKRRHEYGKRVNFTHLLIEGKLSYRGFASFGSYSGNRFFADLGTHNDVPWYCEFVLPVSSENIEPDEHEAILFAHSTGSGSLSIDEVDVSQAIASKDNIIPT